MKKIIICPAGERVKECLQKDGYDSFYCGGRGTCGKCKGEILEGDAGEFTPAEEEFLTEEEKKSGVRLLCQLFAATDLTVCIEVEEGVFGEKEEKPFGNGELLERRNRELLEQRNRELLEWGNKDLLRRERIGKEEKEEREEREEKESRLRDFSLAGSSAEERKKSGKRFGAAFDIGTTTVVGKLFDLERKRPLAEMTAWNPQGCFGADVISRMQYCLEHADGKKELRDKITDCMNEMLRSFQDKAGVEMEAITAAGNSAMTHFLLGEDVDTLARVPFLPGFTKGQVRNAKDCGLLAKDDAKLITLPLLQGQVGGDIAGALLSMDIFSKENGTLLVDIGTNGEIAYLFDGTIYVCSTAAGPALEGAGISCGMRAQRGAIEKVWLMGGEIYTKVIGNTVAQGICGSALIDAVAVLLDLGKLETNGYLENGSVRLSKEAVFSEEDGNLGESKYVQITQEDIRQYQMVKAAIRAGIETVVHAAGKTMGDISELYIAGAFGSNIRKQNAIRTGLLPDLAVEKIKVIGNASLAGASMVLCNKEAGAYAERIREHAILVNLAEKKEFQEAYIKAMDFENV